MNNLATSTQDHLAEQLEEDLADEYDLPELIEQPEPEPIDPEQMFTWLSSPDTLERMQAARAFCEIEEPRAIPLLLNLLQDDCTLVRVSAAYALGRNPDPAVTGDLIQRLQSDWNGYVRKGLVWALGTCGGELALAPLIQALKFDIAAVRLWAASALGQLGNPGAIAALVSALTHDPVDAVRSNCAWALAKLLPLGTEPEIYEEAIDALINALEDDDLGVRDDALSTLRKLASPRGLRVIEKIELDQGFCDLF